ncbi:peptidoglycan DD-metalloendopeptidase family protein (plasmid) [Paenibacillus urinalis]|uniref:Peptidoglycan DD-metalloendopeptidase family protein n=1 Tax=Paenibacillus urinalis TaxID=521520 RepID=A0ABY7XHS9_9BACL|nr:glucosaminidase domain-containing protein [Paenibacillus urinalis]WDH95151.1 peptidoglycan DD-metalloendopeptidase family protein [Paenibacillus urinalis]WDI05377.1 peptidoglycan DD-metalloendopeptidase family protein [Paenibacillus urinalis]
MLDKKAIIGEALQGGLNKENLKQRIKNEAIKRLLNKVSTSLLKNPVFWIVTAVLAGIFMFFFLIAALVSSTTVVASSAFVSERVLPPQIYYRDLDKIITSEFGERTDPVFGTKAFHKGIDFGIPVGTPIISSFDGVVTTVSYPSTNSTESNSNAGIYVSVKSSDPELSSTTRYLHLSEAFVEPGQLVRRGEIIGLSGNTGKSTGPHLHYEWIPEGEEPVDPTPFIMLMSKATDTASKEAFKYFDKVKFSKEDGDYDYFSNKMLYLSGVYMESAAPPFSNMGTVTTRNVQTGASSSTTGEGTETSEDVPEVSVPPNLGSLTHPFFIEYAAAAMEEERRSGVPASVTLAQAALESGYGQRSVCNNVFGIKASKGWKGPTCSSPTKEEYGGNIVTIVGTFRAYSSVEQSFADHSAFLLENPRYRFALAQDNPYAFANELQRAGYATDSQYANKLKSIMRSQNLVSLDANGGIDPATGQPFNDVPFGSGGGSVGSGGSGGSSRGSVNTDGTVTLVFGIQQFYGNYAKQVYRSTSTVTDSKTGKTQTSQTVTKSDLIDPTFNKPIINSVNYNNVVNNGGYGETEGPNLFVKDLPAAIAVTPSSGTDEELYISNVQYVRGTY